MKPELAALINSERTTITPREAAAVLNCGAYALNILYKENRLPFPAMLVGNRLKIMRVPFLRYLGYEED